MYTLHNIYVDLKKRKDDKNLDTFFRQIISEIFALKGRVEILENISKKVEENKGEPLKKMQM